MATEKMVTQRDMLIANVSPMADMYIDHFNQIFEIDSAGNLKMEQSNFNKVGDWYDGCNFLIGLIAGVPVPKITFGTNKEQNIKNLIHIYSLAYIALLKMCEVAKREVPAQYRQLNVYTGEDLHL